MMQNPAPGNKKNNHQTGNQTTPAAIEKKNETDVASMAPEIWLDKQDILQRLHISSRTLQNWRSSGLLPYSKIKGKIYYKETDLELLLQKHCCNKS